MGKVSSPEITRTTSVFSLLNLVVSTQLKNRSQIGSFPPIEMHINIMSLTTFLRKDLQILRSIFNQHIQGDSYGLTDLTVLDFQENWTVSINLAR